MRRYLFALVLAVALPALPAALQAQDSPADKEVYGVVEAFFAGFNAKDTAAMRATLYDDVKLVTTFTNQQGQPSVRVEPVSGLMSAIGGAQGKLFEKIFVPSIEVEDGLANVWVKYEFYVDDKFSHCGIDSFLLVKTQQGWKIASLADTRRRQGCQQ